MTAVWDALMLNETHKLPFRYLKLFAVCSQGLLESSLFFAHFDCAHLFFCFGRGFARNCGLCFLRGREPRRFFSLVISSPRASPSSPCRAPGTALTCTGRWPRWAGARAGSKRVRVGVGAHGSGGGSGRSCPCAELTSYAGDGEFTAGNAAVRCSVGTRLPSVLTTP